jgi:hypothetical protein
VTLCAGTMKSKNSEKNAPVGAGARWRVRRGARAPGCPRRPQRRASAAAPCRSGAPVAPRLAATRPPLRAATWAAAAAAPPPPAAREPPPGSPATKCPKFSAASTTAVSPRNHNSCQVANVHTWSTAQNCDGFLGVTVPSFNQTRISTSSCPCILLELSGGQ